MGLWIKIRIFCHDTSGKEVIMCWPEVNLQLPILQFMNERYSFVDAMTSLGGSGITPGMRICLLPRVDVSTCMLAP